MAELQDYSGDFNPNLKITDFSKEALIRLWEAAAKLYIGMDGMWWTLIKQRYGEKTAVDLSAENWRRAADFELKRTTEAMNIHGDDVATLFKVYQVDPGFAPICDLQFDLKTKNHGILTVTRCKSLEYLERHNEEEFIRNACHVVDVEGFQRLASLVNPRMKATALKLPPRKSSDETPCVWELKVED